MSVLSKITMYPMKTDQYIRTETSKCQIYIHHTASSPNPYGVIRDWNTTPERVGTALVVAGVGGKSSNGEEWVDGKILQTYSSLYWAYHLGLTTAQVKKGGAGAKSNLWLNQHSIGIEICNWGGLTATNAGFLNWAKKRVPDNEVVEYDKAYRGYKYFQKYTDAQLESTRELILFLCNRYNIPSKFIGMRMFDICPEALRGEPGVYTHSSVRPDKSDCHPQKELIEMLQSL